MERFLSSGAELNTHKADTVRHRNRVSRDKNRRKRITLLGGANLSHRFNLEVARDLLGSGLFFGSYAGPLLIDGQAIWLMLEEGRWKPWLKSFTSTATSVDKASLSLYSKSDVLKRRFLSDPTAGTFPL